MDLKKLERMKHGLGFIAALDQSGGSTPKALLGYGIESSAFHNDDEMFDLIHQMRSRVICAPAFSSEHILGAILFEQTMDRTINGLYTSDYLWDVKGVLPFLKVDAGLADLNQNVQLMKPIPQLDELLARAVDRHIFGTKMRSVIKGTDLDGIRLLVKQQFEIGAKIASYNLVPIIEPEVDIHIPDKKEAEIILKETLKAHLDLYPTMPLIFKLSLPSVDDFYADLLKYPNVVRIVALSGGYSQKEANEILTHNHGVIASFSRALLEGLSAQQTDAEFDQTIAHSIEAIAKASNT